MQEKLNDAYADNNLLNKRIRELEFQMRRLEASKEDITPEMLQQQEDVVTEALLQEAELNKVIQKYNMEVLKNQELCDLLIDGKSRHEAVEREVAGLDEYGKLLESCHSLGDTLRAEHSKLKAMRKVPSTSSAELKTEAGPYKKKRLCKCCRIKD